MPLHTDEKRQGGTNNASRNPHASLGARAEGRRNKQTPGKNQHIYVSNINPADSWDKCSTSCALIANRHVRRKLKIQNNQTQIDQFSKCKRNPQIIPSARQTHKGGRYVLNKTPKQIGTESKYAFTKYKTPFKYRTILISDYAIFREIWKYDARNYHTNPTTPPS